MVPATAQPQCDALVRFGSALFGLGYRRCLNRGIHLVTVSQQGQFHLCGIHLNARRSRAVRVATDRYALESVLIERGAD